MQNGLVLPRIGVRFVAFSHTATTACRNRASLATLVFRQPSLAGQPYSPRSVTAPSEAEDTSFAYFASVPRVA